MFSSHLPYSTYKANVAFKPVTVTVCVVLFVRITDPCPERPVRVNLIEISQPDACGTLSLKIGHNIKWLIRSCTCPGGKLQVICCTEIPPGCQVERCGNAYVFKVDITSG